MNNLFSEAQLSALRLKMANIQTIDPCSPSYEGLCDTMDQMTIDQLKQIAGAGIKFMSMLAQNRVREREAQYTGGLIALAQAMVAGGDR